MRAFAVIPAAGRSRRMGRPKLLLPWGEQTIMHAVLAAWHNSQVDEVVVVVHPGDEVLAEACRECGAWALQPHEPPPEMRQSLELGLEYIQQKWSPAQDDAWLTAPADIPTLTSSLIDQLLVEYRDHARESVVVPTFDGRVGHPILLPWRSVDELRKLPSSVGLNGLLTGPTHKLAVNGRRPRDIDTPDDYAEQSHYSN